jgi:hypothetical protein
MKITMMLGILSMCLLGSFSANARSFHCKSWDNFKENVSINIEMFDTHRALINFDLEGQKLETVASVHPWKNFTPNRCGSYASGIEFDVSLSNIHHFHIVTNTNREGCYEPSQIKYDGIKWSGIYLTCEESIN